MTKSQLELALREAAKIARDRDFIVFGSQCILGTVSRPPRVCLLSQELDLYPRSRPQAVLLLAKDLDYVQALFSHGLISPSVLKERLRTLPVTPSSLQEIEKILRTILTKVKAG